jgi:hypothetical protein
MFGSKFDPSDKRESLSEEKRYIARAIRHFLDGSTGEWDWEDFTSAPLKNPQTEEIRQFCAATNRLFPPTENGDWCSEAGSDAMRAIQLRLEIEIQNIDQS